MTDTEAAVVAASSLGATLLTRVVADGDVSGVLSPVSVFEALAIARLGARGRTAAELDRLLASPQLARTGDVTAEAAVLRDALVSRSAADGTELAIALGVWLQQGLQIVDATRRELVSAHGAEVRPARFDDDPDVVVAEIDEWVRHATRDRITGLLAPGSLPDDTRFVLVDALYLRAAWDDPFPVAATADAPFTTLDGPVIEVPTMRRTGPCGFAAGDGWTAVTLGYAGGDLELVLVVPDDPQGLRSLVARLDVGLLADVTAATVGRPVALHLPRFRVATRRRLRDDLLALGLTTAFGPDADFSALVEGDQVMIDDVVHAATITVDEAGTEAAAATALSMRATGAPIDVVEVHVDHPFLFALRDRPTAAVVFVGFVGDPRG